MNQLKINSQIKVTARVIYQELQPLEMRKMMRMMILDMTPKNTSHLAKKLTLLIL
jgi:hypothetical protein